MKQMGDLSNEDLLARLRTHLGEGHAWQAQLIAHLVEVENREIHLSRAYSSMWDFCLRACGMSENEAQLRLNAARLVRRYPIALTYLERGRIHLSGLYAISNYLTTDNHEELLREASGKSVRTIEAMLAARFPSADVPTKVEPAEMQPSLSLNATDGPQSSASPLLPTPPEPRPRGEPLSPARYRIELTVSAEIRARIEHIQDLMRHADPSGDLETIFDRALLLLATVSSAAMSTDRDNRCPARTFLELDHTCPKARDRSDDASNLRVRCRLHNHLHAEETFGRKHVARKIHSKVRRGLDSHSSGGRARPVQHGVPRSRRAPCTRDPRDQARYERGSLRDDRA